MPKMHQNTIGGRTLAGPAGGDYALPQAPYPQWEGLLLRAREEKERRRELGGKGGEGIPEGIPQRHG